MGLENLFVEKLAWAFKDLFVIINGHVTEASLDAHARENPARLSSLGLFSVPELPELVYT